MRITALGDSALCLNLEAALTAAGITTRYSGPLLRKQRVGARSYPLQWFVLFIMDKGIEATTGGVATGLRLDVDRVVRDFKARNPILRMAVDDL